LKVPTKSLQTLQKYGGGAIARRRVKKMMLNNYNEVAALKSPVYAEDGREEIVFVGAPLITIEELDRFLNQEDGGKHLKWISSWQPIKDNYWSNQPLTDEFGNKPSGG
jgi:hypothetical protein